MAAGLEAPPDAWNPFDLLERARAAADPRAAWSVFDTELRRAGFERTFYAFGVPRTSKQPILEKLSRGIFQDSGQFVDKVFPELAKRPDLLATDPVAPHCRKFLTPFEWSHMQLRARESSTFSFANDIIGLSSCLVFPLRNGDGNLYGNFTVFCMDPDHRSWLQHAKRFGPLLHITAQYLHDTLASCDEPPAQDSDIILSPRQRECLLWASRGFSSKRIAHRLGLSEPVVYEYLGSVRRKLGCTTTSHAVARAVSLGLIEP